MSDWKKERRAEPNVQQNKSDVSKISIDIFNSTAYVMILNVMSFLCFRITRSDSLWLTGSTGSCTRHASPRHDPTLRSNRVRLLHSANKSHYTKLYFLSFYGICAQCMPIIFMTHRSFSVILSSHIRNLSQLSLVSPLNHNWLDMRWN